jgi:hypothetical protein
MKWLTNTVDHTIPHWEEYIVASRSIDQSPQEAIQHHKRFLEGKIIGHPKATKKYTTQQLHDMGFIGIYREEHDHE